MTNGYIIGQHRSAIDGQPIVVITTGFANKSTNSKTGGMIQTYIMLRDTPPADAIRQGLDGSICGSCQFRSVAGGGNGACYVNVGQGPRAVWDAYQRGRYEHVSRWEAAEHLRGRQLRIGSYGDPAAVPFGGAFWGTLKLFTIGHTGYTHRWRDIGADLKEICMASVDSVDEALEAAALGWSTFRVKPKGDRGRLPGEAICPASAEAGKKVTCETCPIKCDGRPYMSGLLTGRVIQAHGTKAKRVQ